MTDISQVAGYEAARAPVGSKERTYLFGPVIDFLCLGGGSFIILGLICWFLPNGLPRAQTVTLAFVLVTLINNPHFANSYQIFYRNFREKAFGSYPQSLRWRYVFAGIVVPVVVIAALYAGFAAGAQQHTARYLGWILVPMYFLTGWHYVKQGYGILMVDCAQKKAKFSDRAKLIFRINAYACWGFAWIEMNHYLSRDIHYNGITYSTFALPSFLYIVSLVICEITTIAVLGIFFRRWRETRELPWNGIFAYTASLYLWLIFGGINPLMFLVVPTFHSLQYLAVVWRFRLNADAAHARAVRPSEITGGTWQNSSYWKLVLFVVIGMVLGLLAFKAVPQFLDRYVGYDRGVFGSYFFVFLFSVFINVHHYFIDNVIWRRGNPDVLKYVFMQRSN